MMATGNNRLGAFIRLEAASADEWFTPGRFAALLGLFFFCAFPHVFLGGQTFVLRDYGLYSYPVALYWRESFWQGEVPLWNPLNNCGLPFLAQWSTLVLYPPTLFHMFFPLTWALPVFSVAHLWFGGLGMFFLTRRWTGNALAGAVAGITFSFNGLTLNALMWPHYCAAIAWMPWVVLAAERGFREGGRRNLWAVAAGTMQMLSGMPEIILLTWLFVAGMAGWVMVRGTVPRLKLALRFGAQVAAISALCAAQLLPFLQLLAESHRSAGFGDSRWSMPGTGLANFLVPLFYSYASRGGVYFQYNQYFTSSYYLGLACVWLSLVAAWGTRRARVWGLAGVSVLCLLLALGDEGLLFPWLKIIAPAVGVARYPVKFLFLFMLTAPLLAGYALARYSAATTGERGQVALLAILLLLMGGLAWFARANPMPLDTPWLTQKNALGRAVFLLLLVACFRLLRRRWAVTRGILVRLGLLMLVWLDIWTHAPLLAPTIPSEAYAKDAVKESVRMEPFPAHGHSRLMIAPRVDVQLHYAGVTNVLQDFLVNRATFFSNANLMDGVSKVNGFYSLLLQRPEEIMMRFYIQLAKADGLKDFLGVSQYSDPEDDLSWVSRRTFLPMITAGQKPVFEQEQKALREMFSDDFDARRVVYLPPEARVTVGPAEAGVVQILSTNIGSHRVEAEVESAKPAMLVVSQAHYPAWQARVNGQPAEVLRANHAFQAVVVPAGRSRVTLRYVDRWFLVGGALSVTGLVVWFGAWRAVRRNRTAQSPAGAP